MLKVAGKHRLISSDGLPLEANKGKLPNTLPPLHMEPDRGPGLRIFSFSRDRLSDSMSIGGRVFFLFPFRESIPTGYIYIYCIIPSLWKICFVFNVFFSGEKADGRPC